MGGAMCAAKLEKNMIKNTDFRNVEIGATFAWHGQPYVKATESTANPIEKNNAVSIYAANVGPRERVSVTA
jgi:hypothetical protein